MVYYRLKLLSPNYAIFNFASPLLAVAFAYLGLRMLRAPRTPGAAGAPQPVAR